ncbi:MAG: transposase [Ideonella sp.]|nr:transposase [Ideonella sp.]
MARLPRLAAAGQVHLVLQRSMAGRTAVADEVDAQAWREALGLACAGHGVALHGYGVWPGGCLLLMTPATGPALGMAIQAVGRRYGPHVNRRHGRRGSVWEGRFRSTVLEPEPWVPWALQCVESPDGALAWAADARDRAPADTGPPQWSSAPHHRGERRDPLIQDPPAYWSLGNTPFDREAAWRERLESPLPPGVAARLIGAAERGWVLGSEAFAAQVQAQTARRVQPLPRGRPRKPRPDAA